MTVSSETSRIAYTGAGTTGPFSVPFYFLADDDLKVVKTLISDSTETTLVLTVDYTVSGAADPAGGSVTLMSALSASYKLSIVRSPDSLQETDYQAGDPFPAESHERALDKLTMVMQRVLDLVSRSLHLSDGDVTATDLALPADRASKYLAFGVSGNPVASSGTSSAYVVTPFMETVLDDANAAAARATLGALNLAGDTMTGGLIFKSGLNNIVAAATTDLTGAGAGNTAHITGATGISAWTMISGQIVDVVFDGAPLLTHHVTTNNLPGAANIQAAANDRARFWYDGTTVWCVSYERAVLAPGLATALKSATTSVDVSAATEPSAGQVLKATSSTTATWQGVDGITLGTPVSFNGLNAIDFAGIPSTAKRVTVNLNALSSTGTSDFIIQIGPSGGPEASGYLSESSIGGAVAQSTIGFILTRAIGAATGRQSGSFVLSLENASSNTWCGGGNIYCSNAPEITMNAGIKSLAGALAKVRITTVGGTDTFDAGEVNISYE